MFKTGDIIVRHRYPTKKYPLYEEWIVLESKIAPVRDKYGELTGEEKEVLYAYPLHSPQPPKYVFPSHFRLAKSR